MTDQTRPPTEFKLEVALGALGIGVPDALEEEARKRADDPTMRATLLAGLLHLRVQEAVHRLIVGQQNQEAPGAFIGRLAAVSPQGWPLEENHAEHAEWELSWAFDRAARMIDDVGEGAAPYCEEGMHDKPVDAHASAAISAIEIARDMLRLRSDPEYYGDREGALELLHEHLHRLHVAHAAVGDHHRQAAAEQDVVQGGDDEHDHDLGLPDGFEDPAGRPVNNELLSAFAGAAFDRCQSCQDVNMTLIVEDSATTARLVELACTTIHAQFGGLPRSLLDDDVPGPAAPPFRRLARAGADGNNAAMFELCEQMTVEDRRAAANTAADFVVHAITRGE
ncbi:hypothetical protein [Streptomyces alboflavus]|uniref:hypothetical protein n=1 Tax=Streptomyces alboflavus TaxID=67267 RepID=UPI00367887AA